MSDDSYLGEASRVVPAEWERHSRTIVSWPTREAIWNPIAPQACEEYVQIIEAILPYEPVVVVCRQQDEDRVASLIPKEAVLVAHPIDDGWIRDSGPLAIRVGESLVAVDFAFNSWGGRFAPWTGDAAVGEMLARYCDVPHEYVPFVLEEGAISFNGDGTALVIEECVLNKNRNGAVSRKRFESLIGAHLGVDKVIWLPFGLLEDLAGTDGHVDNVAIFVDVDRVLVQMVDQMNPNFGRLSRNVEVLRSSRNSRGSRLEIEIIASLPYTEVPGGVMQPAPYVNLAITNGSVLIPSVGSPSDEVVAGFLGELFRGRVPKLVRSYALTHGGGGPHCITLQWPGPWCPEPDTGPDSR